MAAIMDQIGLDLVKYGVAFEVDGLRIDPSRIRMHTPIGQRGSKKTRVNKRKGRAAAFQADERGVRLSWPAPISRRCASRKRGRTGGSRKAKRVQVPPPRFNFAVNAQADAQRVVTVVKAGDQHRPLQIFCETRAPETGTIHQTAARRFFLAA